MSYFDSPKNEALWNKEVDRLKTVREQRKSGIEVARQISPQEQSARAVNEKGQLLREPVTFFELMAEERAENPISRSVDRFADRSMRQTKEMKSPEKTGPQMSGPRNR